MKRIIAKYQVDQPKLLDVVYPDGIRQETIHFATVFEREFILESEDQLRDAVLKLHPETRELSFLGSKTSEWNDGSEPTSGYVNQDR
jgi:hypothetical protein